jgi:hypothetical protein
MSAALQETITHCEVPRARDGDEIHGLSTTLAARLDGAATCLWHSRLQAPPDQEGIVDDRGANSSISWSDLMRSSSSTHSRPGLQRLDHLCNQQRGCPHRVICGQLAYLLQLKPATACSSACIGLIVSD